MLPARATAPREHTTRPILTGSSVLGIIYNGGVMLAADTQLSYGSMAKSQNAQRLTVIGGGVLVGASGEYSDYQEIVELLERKALEEGTTSLMDSIYKDVAAALTAESTWNYMRMVMYSRRNKMNPYWNDVVVAGASSATGQPFLGVVDKIGTAVGGDAHGMNFCATGMGSYMALPLLREKWRPDLTEGEARALLEDGMRVLFYRDCRASAKICLAKWSTDATTGAATALVSEPYLLETSWGAAAFQEPIASLEGDGGF